ncbi:MAG: hypothetical protein AAF525_01595 [Pseudomonadota bacterium]
MKSVLVRGLKFLAFGLVGFVIILYGLALFVPIDPVERQPGIGLSGSLATEQNPDWSMLGNGRTMVWVETRTWYLIPHSITAMAWTDGNHLYVGCRSCDGKFWSSNVRQDDRVRIKVDDQLYERRAVRLDDASRRVILGVPEGEPLPDRAVFRMDPR